MPTVTVYVDVDIDLNETWDSRVDAQKLVGALGTAIATIPEDCRASATVSFSTFEETVSDVSLRYERPETSAETKVREDELAARREIHRIQKERNDARTWLELQRQYGSLEELQAKVMDVPAGPDPLADDVPDAEWFRRRISGLGEEMIGVSDDK